MTETPWWDIVGIAAIGVICLALIARRLRQAFAESSGGGCPGCSKSCGSGKGDKPC